MLTLPEQLMLIALKDEKGTVLFTAMGILPFAIIGAILIELYFAGKINIEKNKIFVQDYSPTGNDFFDDVLKIISESGSKKEAKNLLLKINVKIKNIKERTLEYLVEKKVLKEENYKIFSIIKRKKYPTINPEPEKELRFKIRNFILKQESPDERNIALLSLINVSRLLEDIFNKDEIKTAKERINEIIDRTHSGEAISGGTSRILKSISMGIVDASGTGKLTQ
jgi:golgi phosphoprotein 3